MGCGIYKIENLKTGKVYIGSSINIKNRKADHLSCLRGGHHDNIHLQRAWNKYGEKHFRFKILITCHADELVDLENYFITAYMANGKGGYNMAMVNEFRRNTFNEEVKVKLSKHYLKRYGNFTKFKLINKLGEERVFESLVEAAHYLKDNGYANGKLRNIRLKLSIALRGVVVNNITIRKTCYQHIFKIIK